MIACFFQPAENSGCPCGGLNASPGGGDKDEALMAGFVMGGNECGRTEQQGRRLLRLNSIVMVGLGRIGCGDAQYCDAGEQGNAISIEEKSQRTQEPAC